MILRVNSEFPCLGLVPFLHLGMVRLLLEWPPNVTSGMDGWGKIRTQNSLFSQQTDFCKIVLLNYDQWGQSYIHLRLSIKIFYIFDGMSSTVQGLRYNCLILYNHNALKPACTIDIFIHCDHFGRTITSCAVSDSGGWQDLSVNNTMKHHLTTITLSSQLRRKTGFGYVSRTTVVFIVHLLDFCRTLFIYRKYDF